MKRPAHRSLQTASSRAPLRKRTAVDRSWERWLDDSDRLALEIRSRLGRDLSVDDLLSQSRQELEQRRTSPE